MVFTQLFPVAKPIIGMISLPPLLGYPAFPGLTALIDRALEDLSRLAAGGVDGVLVENDFDRPHRLTAGPEVVASFTAAAQEVTRQARVPVGLQVLLNDWRASLAIARVVRAQFVRLDFFVDRVRIAAGEIRPEPAAVLAHRRELGAGGIALFADVQVKHSELLEVGKPIATSAAQAAAAGADAIVVTGRLTGEGPTLEDLRGARAGAGEVPVLVGSGLTPASAGEVLPLADGAIVGTALRQGPAATEGVDPDRVSALMAAVRQVRAAPAR